MKAWRDVVAHDGRIRLWIAALLGGLVVGGVAYWRTGTFFSAAVSALAGAAVVLVLGMGTARRRVIVELEASLAAWKRLWVSLIGDNAAVRVGVVVLFFGVALLIKYAYESAGVLSIEARLIGAALGAAILLALGWRLRTRRPAYGQALQGGGVGLLYLAIFGAGHSSNLLQGNAAFVLLIAVVALAGYLAVIQDARWIAILGIAAGFLAPVLLVNGEGSGVMLFGYYLVLNLGIFFVAFHKSWRSLNVIGLLFTFGIASVWGARFYRPDHFSSTEPFLILFFLLYVGIAVIHAWRQAPRFDDYVDSVIVFGAPLLAFGLQIQLVRHFEHGAAWSAIAVSAFYLIVAATLGRCRPETLRMLVQAFFALGLIFATAALPLAFDGRVTSGLWALEGVAIYWLGDRQGKPLARIAGLLLQLGAGVALITDTYRGTSELPVLNGFYLNCAVVAFAGLLCSIIMERHAGKSGAPGPHAAMGVFLWGLGWWVLGGLHEISVHAPREDVLSAALLFLTGTCAAFSFLWGRGWQAARFPALALVPLMAIILAFQVFERADSHPLARLGVAAWPIAFLFHFRILRRHQDLYPHDLSIAHAMGMWLLAAVGTWEAAWQIDRLAQGQYAWSAVAWAVVPIALLAAVAALRQAWPVARYPGAYLWTGVKPLLAFLAIWLLYANFPSDAEPASPRYIPLLNPLDIAHVAAFGVLVYWWRAVRASGIDGPREYPATWPVTAWCVVIFIWANAVLMRTLHHYAGVPYQIQAMLESNLVQMCISIFWTLLALATMFVATRRRIRQMWIVGSVLMAAVVLKLLIIEVPRAGELESLVSIVSVGALMLVIGYLAPTPPRQVDAA